MSEISSMDQEFQKAMSLAQQSLAQNGPLVPNHMMYPDLEPEHPPVPAPKKVKSSTPSSQLAKDVQELKEMVLALVESQASLISTPSSSSSPEPAPQPASPESTSIPETLSGVFGETEPSDDAYADQRVQVLAENAMKVARQLGHAKLMGHVNKALINYIGMAIDYRSFTFAQQTEIERLFVQSMNEEDLKAAATILLNLCDKSHVTESRVAYFAALVSWVMLLLSVGSRNS